MAGVTLLQDPSIFGALKGALVGLAQCPLCLGHPCRWWETHICLTSSSSRSCFGMPLPPGGVEAPGSPAPLRGLTAHEDQGLLPRAQGPGESACQSLAATGGPHRGGRAHVWLLSSHLKCTLTFFKKQITQFSLNKTQK